MLLPPPHSCAAWPLRALPCIPQLALVATRGDSEGSEHGEGGWHVEGGGGRAESAGDAVQVAGSLSSGAQSVVVVANRVDSR
jgi:hypothetical protein